MTLEERLIEALKAYTASKQEAPSFEAVVFADCEAKKTITELCFSLKLDTRTVLKGLSFDSDKETND